MKLTEPKYSKKQVLEMTCISSAQFDNWMHRGLVPRDNLGFKLVKKTKARYSILIIAYCRLLAYHTGQNRKLYIQTLITIFEDLVVNNNSNYRSVITIDNYGKGSDCKVFEITQAADLSLHEQCLIVPVGKVISGYMEIFKLKTQDLKLESFGI